MSVEIDFFKNTLVLSLINNNEGIYADDFSDKILTALETQPVSHINIDGSNLKEWDTALLAGVLTVIQTAKKKNIPFQTKKIPPQMQQLLNLALTVDRKPQEKKHTHLPFLDQIGVYGINIYNSTKKGLSFIWQTLNSVGRLLNGRAIMRPIDFLFALENAGWKAVGIVSLISFMVGLILAFVGAVQLKLFGAQVYVASLVTIAMTRIMGAIMMGIIMAGRTGASYAATIGTMQVNEEIDALKTMGIPVTDFLVLPRFLALIITMPFLTMWADFMGMLGGGIVSILMLDIAPQEYIKYSINAFDVTNFLVGVFHGLIFGCVIALCGCYYGINCGRNADSVGVATTHSVVSAIVWMIIMTGIITLLCEVIGI